MIRLQKFSLGGAGILIVVVGLSLLLQGDPPTSARGDQSSMESDVAGFDGGATYPNRGGSDKHSVGKSSSSTKTPLELDVDPSQFTKGDLKLGLTVTPSCVLRGQSITARLMAVSGAYVSLIVAYSDGQNYGAMYAGPVALDGSLTYPWVIPLNAAYGRGWVFATGHDPNTEKSGSTAATFTVGGVQGC